MSINAPITDEDEMFAGETKTIRIGVTGLTTLVGLLTRWHYSLGPRLPALFTKNGPIVGEITYDFYTAIITVNGTDTEDLPAGTYYHTLWDTGNNLVLAEGRAVLKRGIPEA